MFAKWSSKGKPQTKSSKIAQKYHARLYEESCLVRKSACWLTNRAKSRRGGVSYQSKCKRKGVTKIFSNEADCLQAFDNGLKLYGSCGGQNGDKHDCWTDRGCSSLQEQPVICLGSVDLDSKLVNEIPKKGWKVAKIPKKGWKPEDQSTLDEKTEPRISSFDQQSNEPIHLYAFTLSGKDHLTSAGCQSRFYVRLAGCGSCNMEKYKSGLLQYEMESESIQTGSKCDGWYAKSVTVATNVFNIDRLIGLKLMVKMSEKCNAQKDHTTDVGASVGLDDRSGRRGGFMTSGAFSFGFRRESTSNRAGNDLTRTKKCTKRTRQCRTAFRAHNQRW